MITPEIRSAPASGRHAFPRPRRVAAEWGRRFFPLLLVVWLLPVASRAAQQSGSAPPPKSSSPAKPALPAGGKPAAGAAATPATPGAGGTKAKLPAAQGSVQPAATVRTAGSIPPTGAAGTTNTSVPKNAATTVPGSLGTTAPSAPGASGAPGAPAPAPPGASAAGSGQPPEPGNPSQNRAASPSRLAVQQQSLAIQEQNFAVQEQTFRRQQLALPPAPPAATSKPMAMGNPEGFLSVHGNTGESLFYSVPGPRSMASFREHAARIGIIAPQCFSLDHRGTLRGSLPDGLMAVAMQSHVGVMPLVVNADFSQWGANRLLRSPAARDRAIDHLVRTAVELHLIGWQIDFENLRSYDRRYLTRFVHEVGVALHRKGKLLSVAVAARTSDERNHTWYTFSGVYDYAGLAQSADFLSVMAYPEYDGSHPGPLAGYPWVQQVIQFVLRSVPADRISLGLPTYQTDWGERRVRITIIRRVGRRLRRFFRWVYRLIARNGAADHGDSTLHWDPVLKSSYRVYWRGRIRHIVWVEDERSFAAKLHLVAKYHLYGFSVWRIGLEDPHIWSVLPRVSRLVEVRQRGDGQLPSLIDRAEPQGADAGRMDAMPTASMVAGDPPPSQPDAAAGNATDAGSMPGAGDPPGPHE